MTGESVSPWQGDDKPSEDPQDPRTETDPIEDLIAGARERAATKDPSPAAADRLKQLLLGAIQFTAERHELGAIEAGVTSEEARDEVKRHLIEGLEQLKEGNQVFRQAEADQAGLPTPEQRPGEPPAEAGGVVPPPSDQ